jgi:hypothetical protein
MWYGTSPPQHALNASVSVLPSAGSQTTIRQFKMKNFKSQ